MTEHKGPFDAALMYLPDIDECRPAIHVLEAAGRLEKKSILSEAAYSGDNVSKKWIAERSQYIAGWNDCIRILFKSLPEPEEERKDYEGKA